MAVEPNDGAPAQRAGVAVAAAKHIDADGDGLPDEYAKPNTDVNLDGRPDAVGFGLSAVSVGLNTGTSFAAATAWSTNFDYDTGWRVDQHPRVMVDVTGDGLPDVVGFATNDVYVGVNTGTGFAAPTIWSNDFCLSDGWQVTKHPRFVKDVTGDGLPDLVGIGYGQVMVGVNTGTGFAPATAWSDDFAYDDGWRVTKHPRFLRDVTGDERPDLVGFGDRGVVVGVNTGTGFAPAANWSGNFGYADGWRVDQHPRFLADVAGDGRLDVIGVGRAHVYVAVNKGNRFGPAEVWSNDFVSDDGWQVDKHPRFMADVTGDHRPDLVAFGNRGVSVGVNKGHGFAPAKVWSSEFGFADGWRLTQHPRMIVDVTGDQRPDLVGFGNANVLVAVNTGSGFAPTKAWSDDFVYADGWRVNTYPRYLG